MRNRPGNFNNARVPRRSGVAGPFVVPRLEELVGDPGQVRVLDAHTTRVLRTQAIAALNVLNGHDLDLALDGIAVRQQDRRTGFWTCSRRQKRSAYHRIGSTVITSSCRS